MEYITPISNWLEAHNGALTALANILLAVFTCLLAVFTWRLWVSTNRLWLESKRAGDTAERALVAGERAFVFAVAIFSEYYPIANTSLYEWRLHPQWQNSGDTPTKNLTIYTYGELRDTPLPTGFDFDVPIDEPGTGLLPPKVTLTGGIFPRANEPAISPQDILEIQEGRKFLYLWGWAKYQDVFPGTPQHVTRFCWLVTPNGNPMDFVPESTNAQERLIFQYRYHPQGNCADDECGKN